jgi:hypothetical protein
MYYAGAEGVQVYSEPSASSKIVGKLSLHEKVIRTKLEKGYAYVQSTKSSVKGWVKNADLIQRLPTAPTTGTPSPTSPEAPAAEELTPEAATPAGELPPTPTSTPVAPAPSTPTRGGVAPSIFNPY